MKLRLKLKLKMNLIIVELIKQMLRKVIIFSNDSKKTFSNLYCIQILITLKVFKEMFLTEVI